MWSDGGERRQGKTTKKSGFQIVRIQPRDYNNDSVEPVNLTHHFLIAMPGMADPNFSRTLTYICEHSADGALGVVVNRPTDMNLSVLFERLNLSLNSRDAMLTGGRLLIETGMTDLDEAYAKDNREVTPGRYVLISVSDTGDGIPKDIQEKVFEPFFTTKAVGRGTGLGLSMVYGFVKQSNGHLTIYSEPGLGTTVRIYLPAMSSAESQQENNPDAQEREDYARSTGAENILVVEDDMFVRTYAITCLETLGYRVLSAVDGREALALLAGGVEIDGLFTDVVMPGGINGWELIDRARRLRPGMPVLLCSGYAIETLGAHGRLPDDVVFLNKPYTKADLARYLRRALDSRIMKQS